MVLVGLAYPIVFQQIGDQFKSLCKKRKDNMILDDSATTE